MTTRRVRRTVRRSAGGIQVAADLDAVIATNGGAATSVSAVTVTQRAARRPGGRPAGETTKGDQ